MDRRKFIFASGSALLGSTTLTGLYSLSSIALNFEITNVPRSDPSDVKSILIDFSKFSLVTSYIDDSKELDVTIDLKIDNQGSDIVQKQVSVKNGESIKRSDLSSELPLNVDKINSNEGFIDGEIKISVTHDSIGTESYKQRFTIGDKLYYEQTFKDISTGNLPSGWSRKSDVDSSDGDAFEVAESNGNKFLYHNDDRSGCTGGNAPHLIQPKLDAEVKVDIKPSGGDTNRIKYYGKDERGNTRFYGSVEFHNSGNIKLSTTDASNVIVDTYIGRREYEVRVSPPDITNGEVTFYWKDTETGEVNTSTQPYSEGDYSFDGITGRMSFIECNGRTDYDNFVIQKSDL